MKALKISLEQIVNNCIQIDGRYTNLQCNSRYTATVLILIAQFFWSAVTWEMELLKLKQKIILQHLQTTLNYSTIWPYHSKMWWYWEHCLAWSTSYLACMDWGHLFIFHPRSSQTATAWVSAKYYAEVCVESCIQCWWMHL